jgi:hypothetical protein
MFAKGTAGMTRDEFKDYYENKDAVLAASSVEQFTTDRYRIYPWTMSGFPADWSRPKGMVLRSRRCSSSTNSASSIGRPA